MLSRTVSLGLLQTALFDLHPLRNLSMDSSPPASRSYSPIIKVRAASALQNAGSLASELLYRSR